MLQIRKITQNDVEAVDKIFYDTWLQVYPNSVLGITEADIHELYKDIGKESEILRMKEIIKGLPEKVLYFVAEVDGKVIGLARSFISQNSNELNAIYVLPEFQGKGVGQALWEESYKHYNKANETFVFVAEYNLNAITFYQSLGFKELKNKEIKKDHIMPLSKVAIPEIKMVLSA